MLRGETTIAPGAGRCISRCRDHCGGSRLNLQTGTRTLWLLISFLKIPQELQCKIPAIEECFSLSGQITPGNKFIGTKFAQNISERLSSIGTCFLRQCFQAAHSGLRRQPSLPLFVLTLAVYTSPNPPKLPSKGCLLHLARFKYNGVGVGVCACQFRRSSCPCPELRVCEGVPHVFRHSFCLPITLIGICDRGRHHSCVPVY